jgi:hypothetical protein
MNVGERPAVTHDPLVEIQGLPRPSTSPCEIMTLRLKAKAAYRRLGNKVGNTPTFSSY